MHRILNAARKVSDIACPKYHYRIRPESITKTYTANNLMDYADAHFARYTYFRDEFNEVFSERHEKLLEFVADGISKVWRWWYGCNADEKKIYAEKINSLSQFSRDHFPLFGYPSWPKYLRISAPFMRSSSGMSFAVLYALNQPYRKLWPEKANVG